MEEQQNCFHFTYLLPFVIVLAFAHVLIIHTHYLHHTIFDKRNLPEPMSNRCSTSVVAAAFAEGFRVQRI